MYGINYGLVVCMLGVLTCPKHNIHNIISCMGSLHLKVV